MPFDVLPGGVTRELILWRNHYSDHIVLDKNPRALKGLLILERGISFHALQQLIQALEFGGKLDKTVGKHSAVVSIDGVVIAFYFFTKLQGVENLRTHADGLHCLGGGYRAGFTGITIPALILLQFGGFSFSTQQLDVQVQITGVFPVTQQGRIGRCIGRRVDGWRGWIDNRGRRFNGSRRGIGRTPRIYIDGYFGTYLQLCANTQAVAAQLVEQFKVGDAGVVQFGDFVQRIPRFDLVVLYTFGFADDGRARFTANDQLFSDPDLVRTQVVVFFKLFNTQVVQFGDAV